MKKKEDMHKMLKYSFMSKYSNCSKQEAIDLVKITNKPFKYTYGLSYRNPTTHNVPITREKALEYMEDITVNMTEYEEYVHINRYSSNDLW